MLRRLLLAPSVRRFHTPSSGAYGVLTDCSSNTRDLESAARAWSCKYPPLPSATLSADKRSPSMTRDLEEQYGGEWRPHRWQDGVDSRGEQSIVDIWNQLRLQRSPAEEADFWRVPRAHVVENRVGPGITKWPAAISVPSQKNIPTLLACAKGFRWHTFPTRSTNDAHGAHNGAKVAARTLLYTAPVLPAAQASHESPIEQVLVSKSRIEVDSEPIARWMHLLANSDYAPITKYGSALSVVRPALLTNSSIIAMHLESLSHRKSNTVGGVIKLVEKSGSTVIVDNERRYTYPFTVNFTSMTVDMESVDQTSLAFTFAPSWIRAQHADLHIEKLFALLLL